MCPFFGVTTWLPHLVFLLLLAPHVAHVRAEPRTPTCGGRAAGQGDRVTQGPPDEVVVEQLECTLVCMLTRSQVTVPAGEQGAKYML